MSKEYDNHEDLEVIGQWHDVKFLKISLKEWLKKYPSLTVEAMLCQVCKIGIKRLDKPAIRPGYVGLHSGPCPHCGTIQAYSEWLTNSDETRNFITDLGNIFNQDEKEDT